ncbi:MAG: universal stress protein [Kouleothrix sp.]|nr:universal stress protein [Kouleothrix sp.]
MFRRVLVPLDGSSFGEHALPFARSIACRAGASLHLAHIHVIGVPMTLDSVPMFDTAMDTQSRQQEQVYLARLAQQLEAGGELRVTTSLLDGAVAEALQEYAASSGVDLVVMTTHGRGAFSRAWLGSTADALVRLAPVPILLVRPCDLSPNMVPPVELRHVLIPLDGSPLAEQVLAHAATLGALTDARLTLLHAIAPEVTGGLPVPGHPTLEQARDIAQGYLDRIAERLGAQSLDVRTEIVVGHPATGILEYARSHTVDLIALATHGRSGVARLLLGSVADKIVRGTTTPVMIYHPSSG